MKNTKKYGLVGGIILLILFCVGFFAKKWMGSVDGKLHLLSNGMISVDKMETELAKKDSLLTVIITNNEVTHTFLLREFHLQTLKMNKQNEQFQKLNHLLEEQKININNLRGHLQLNTSTKDSLIANLTPILNQDSIKNDTSTLFTNYFFVDTSNKHLKLSGNIDLIKRQGKFNYEHFATYEILTHTKKNGLFKHPDLIASIVSDDPNTQISLKSYYVKTKKPKYDLGVGVGLSSGFYKKKVIIIPSFQIGIYKSLISFY